MCSVRGDTKKTHAQSSKPASSGGKPAASGGGHAQHTQAPQHKPANVEHPTQNNTQVHTQAPPQHVAPAEYIPGRFQREGTQHRCDSPATHHRNKVICSPLLLFDPLPRRLQKNNRRKFTPKAKDFVTLSSTASGGKLDEWTLRLCRALYPISVE